LTKFLEALIV